MQLESVDKELNGEQNPRQRYYFNSKINSQKHFVGSKTLRT